jgi:hypothetical protein
MSLDTMTVTPAPNYEGIANKLLEIGQKRNQKLEEIERCLLAGDDDGVKKNLREFFNHTTQ